MNSLFDLDDFDATIDPQTQPPIFQPFQNPPSSTTTNQPSQPLISLSNIPTPPSSSPSFQNEKNSNIFAPTHFPQNSPLPPSSSNQETSQSSFSVIDTIDPTIYDTLSPIRTYSFPLDPFQKRSIFRLENNENLLVCAPTSSGKTIIAEYAIALGKKNSKRVIYTSPIKALSNQKYSEFKKIFDDVGILTGDVAINVDAQCIIMTTEILQNYLYNNNPIIHQVEWVIFDEAHYMNDYERGHVWEEIIILLPKEIKIVMLSATIKNHESLGEWVGQIKNKKIYIELNEKRVVPLEHRIFVDSDNTYLIMDKDNIIDEEKIKSAYYKNRCDHKKFYNNKKEAFSNVIRILNINITHTHKKLVEMVQYLQTNKLFPSVFFIFSIKRAYEYAKFLYLFPFEKNLISDEEKKEIEITLNKYLSILPKEFKSSQELKEIKTLLFSGIGVHNSGMLPPIKELIEILYTKNLIKVLIATTSFSLGLNMPTKSVIFCELYKYNNTSSDVQFLTSTEYLQMGGRAGRRGKDDIGYVYIILSQDFSKKDMHLLTKMLNGKGDDIESQFRLSYRTIISFSVHNKSIDNLFKESFFISNYNKQIEQIKNKVDLYNSKISEIDKIINDEHNINSIKFFDEVTKNLNEICEEYKILFEMNIFYKILSFGRFIKVRKKDSFDFNYVIVIKYNDTDNKIWCLRLRNRNDEIIENEEDDENNDDDDYHSIKGDINDFLYEYRTYSYSDIIQVYNLSLKGIGSYKSEDNSTYILLTDNSLKYALPRLSLLNDDEEKYKLRHKDRKFTQYDYNNKILNKRDINQNERMLLKQSISKINNLLSIISDQTTIYKSRKHIIDLHFKKLKYTSIKKSLSKKLESMSMENNFKELNSRINVLKKLNYIDENDNPTLIGRAAREINTTDFLLVTQLLLSNILNNLNDDELVAFLSCFVYNKNEINWENPKISKSFYEDISKFRQIYCELLDYEVEQNLEENIFNRKIYFGYCKAILKWMQGEDFTVICKTYDIDNGKFYNYINRIYLFLFEISNFYNDVENENYAKKFLDIREKLKRGIMNVNSFYLTNI